MENPLTRHFRLLDSFKDLLFNATTTEQEERARKLVNYLENQENYLYLK